MALIIRNFPRTDYRTVFEAMRSLTAGRSPGDPDELWLVEHDPVFTVGKTIGHAVCGPSISGIEVVPVDRGGDITYHGPGQVVAYPLIDLRRAKIFVKEYVRGLEECIIATLADFGLASQRHAGAAGVYVRMPGGSGQFAGEAKIASLGVKLSHGCTYHGLALNVDMDLRPFRMIAPCGYAQLRVTDMRTLGVEAGCGDVRRILTEHFKQIFPL